MIKAKLQRGDGISADRIWLRSVVRNMQRGLAASGFDVVADGKFGGGTKEIVEAFQASQGQASTGVVARDTWRSLDPFLDEVLTEEAEIQKRLKGFRGDLDWVHQQEGHRGKPYWPGGVSGVTLDPGVDLGHAAPENIESLYGERLNQREMRALRQVFGLKGEDARAALKLVPGLLDIRISDEQALTVMPHAAEPYWRGISGRFSGLTRKDTPPSVQTALLSLAYNRGIFNRGLEPLGSLIAERDWTGVSTTIGKMQQTHKLAGIRTRRRREAALIAAELALIT